MKKKIMHYTLMALAFAMSFPTLQAAIWSGVTVSDVTDEDLEIQSDVILPDGATKIEAINQDITVTFTSDISIKEWESGASILYLVPHEGRTITFKINKKVFFLGKSSATGEHLLIAQGGKGKVVWGITGGSYVKFDGPVSGSGTEYCLFVQDGTDTPEAHFIRHPDESDHDKTLDLYIDIGEHSAMRVISTALVGDDSVKGSFIFDPSNTDKGRMQLQISDRGAIVVSPRSTYVTALTDLTRASMQKSKLSGGIAEFKVINGKDSSAHASLFIANKNKTMPEFLFDPFLHLGVRDDHVHYKGLFNGAQYGFVVGSHGLLTIGDDANINYVGLDVNRSLNIAEVPGYAGVPVEKLLKHRNPSALFFDQSLNPLAIHPTVSFGTTSALFLRSGIGKAGNVRSLDQTHPYTVKEADQNKDVPYFLMDVEGNVTFEGVTDSAGLTSKIEVLSSEVDTQGGSLLINGLETNFPTKNFAVRSNGDLYRYNSGALFVNGYCKLKNMTLVHTNTNAKVYSKDDAFSQPTYVGGETFKLLGLDKVVTTDIASRPKIAFESSQLYIHEHLATSGVDLLVPNQVEIDGNAVPNLSRFVWFYNGYKVDSGTGRSMILGTTIGSHAIDGVTEVSADGHLDVMQNTDCFSVVNIDPVLGDHRLSFEVAPNDQTIVKEIGTDIIEGGPVSQHLVYLGHNSNVSIGTNENTTGFTADTHPMLRINGNYFAFETSGGPLNDARSAGRTGRGGIFVDLNGTFSIGELYNAFIGSMVVKSRNAVLNLPIENIEFGKQVGITDWALNFDATRVRSNNGVRTPDEYTPGPDVSDSELVATGDILTDYSVDWQNIQKDPSFVPYAIDHASIGKRINNGRVVSAEPSPVTSLNLLSIPTIKGDVEQLQISGSRLGDPAHIRIDGGYVHELVFVDTTPEPDAGQAPVAVIVLENGARVGIGSADRNADSAEAAVTLGRNGIIIISNKGSNEVILNNSVIVNGNAPFLFGPDSQSGDVLRISSDVDDQFIIRQNGVLDLRAVDNGRVIEFAGQLSVVFEPNTKLLFKNGNNVDTKGILRFTENTQLNMQEYQRFDELFNSFSLGAINNTLDPLAPVAASATERNEFAPVLNYGDGLQNTDSFRVRIIGSGIIECADKASVFIPYGAVVGVETYHEVLDVEANVVADYSTTDIQLNLKDGAQLYIGNQNYAEGGVFQVGNTSDLGADHTVKFNLTLNGKDARFVTGSKSILGLNVGAVKANGNVPSENLVDTLYNVAAISFNINDGVLDLSRIYDTDDAHANIVAIGDNGDGTPVYGFSYAEVGAQVDTIAELRAQNATVLGGSPIVFVSKGVALSNTDGAVSPIVRADDGSVVVGTDTNGDALTSQRLQVGMVASTLLQDVSQNEVAVTAATLFDQLKTADAYEGVTAAQDKANAATEDEDFMDAIESIRIGTVASGKLIRQSISDVFSGIGGVAANARKAATQAGAVFADISSTLGSIVSAAGIPL